MRKHLVEPCCSHHFIFNSCYFLKIKYADVAHLVERHLAKVEVAGSSPVIRSKKHVYRAFFFIGKLLLHLGIESLKTLCGLLEMLTSYSFLICCIN